MVYKWKEGAFGKTGAVKAQVAGKVLEQLERTRTGVTPKAIVSHARPVRSKIHDWFEWDDTVAAEKHRESQAQDMVQAVVVVYEDKKDGPQECRAFVTIVEDNRRHYVSTARVLSESSLKQQAINDVLRSIDQQQARLSDYKGYEKAIATLGRARKQIKSKK